MKKSEGRAVSAGVGVMALLIGICVVSFWQNGAADRVLVSVFILALFFAAILGLNFALYYSLRRIRYFREGAKSAGRSFFLGIACLTLSLLVLHFAAKLVIPFLVTMHQHQMIAPADTPTAHDFE